jgi:hypothetical protein
LELSPYVVGLGKCKSPTFIKYVCKNKLSTGKSQDENFLFFSQFIKTLASSSQPLLRQNTDLAGCWLEYAGKMNMPDVVGPRVDDLIGALPSASVKSELPAALRLFKAKFLATRGYYRDSLKAFLEAFALQDKVTASQKLSLASTYLYSGDIKNATALLAKVAKTANTLPTGTQVYLSHLQSRAEWQAGNFAEAIEKIKAHEKRWQAVQDKSDQNSSESFNRILLGSRELAYIYFEQGHGDLAEKMLRDYIHQLKVRLGSKKVDYGYDDRINLSLYLLQQHKTKEALAEANAAQGLLDAKGKLFSGDARAYGTVRFLKSLAVGDTRSAKSEYQKIEDITGPSALQTKWLKFALNGFKK